MEAEHSSQLTVHSSHRCAVLLTPPGAAAIAVVRTAGSGVSEFLEAHFTGKPVVGRAVHGNLVDGSETIDDAVVVLGEDARFADISVHGGAWVVRSVLDLARREGFEEARAGDAGVAATEAASELEREILSHLPLATTELGLRSLLAQERAWRELQNQLADRAALQRILDDKSLHWLLHPPRVAIVGAANVGKSTLANQLFAQERSITADLPGTTRDWVGELANLNGLPVVLVDTPGIRETRDAIEARAINASAEQIRLADLVLLVVDASRPMAPEQSALLDRFREAIVILNKIDLPRRAEVSGIETVATSGQGIDLVVDQVLKRFDSPQTDCERARCWTQRQREMLREKIASRPESSQG